MTTVLLFGRLGECFGREVAVVLPRDGWTIADLRRHLSTLVPGGEEILDSVKVRACVDQVMAEEGTMVGSGQEVAFFPPVSGG